MSLDRGLETSGSQASAPRIVMNSARPAHRDSCRFIAPKHHIHLGYPHGRLSIITFTQSVKQIICRFLLADQTPIGHIVNAALDVDNGI